MKKYPISLKLLTKERADKVQSMQNAGVNISQLLRNCIDGYPLGDRKKEVAA